VSGVLIPEEGEQFRVIKSRRKVCQKEKKNEGEKSHLPLVLFCLRTIFLILRREKYLYSNPNRQ
jgi:hypothetical protein